MVDRSRGRGSAEERLAGCPVDVGMSDAELLDAVVAFYRASLADEPEAQAFLGRRGLADAGLLDSFGVGFSNRSLGLVIPEKNRVAGKALRGRLTGLGVLRPSGHEHLLGCVVVPVRDGQGRVVELYGRRIDDGHAKPGAPRHFFTRTPPVGIFNIATLAVTDEVIIAGSVLDALSWSAAGFAQVIACYGSDGFTDEHEAALTARGVVRVSVAFRRDEVGDVEAKRLAGRLASSGVEVGRVEFAWGQDANDVVVAAKSPAGVLGRLLRGASWLGGTAPTGRVDPAGPGAAPPDADEVAVNELDDINDDPDDVEGGVGVVLGDVPGARLVGDELQVSFGERRWRVRGLAKNTSFDVLRVNVLVAVGGEGHGAGFHVDSFDLYASRSRVLFAKEAAGELNISEEVLRRDLGRVLRAGEALRDAAVRAAQEPADTTVTLSGDERTAALELLRDPDLVGRIVADFGRCGMVGETTNALVGYLATVSRLLERPLAIVVQSTSAAGKSALMDAVLAFVPGEEAVRFSAMTGQSLYYLGERDLAHKVLAIAEEEGAERASYALKLLQSEGEVSIASTGKDNASGRLVTHEYRVSGPTAILLTTTAVDVDEELLNRCVVLSVDEDQAQTRAIHDRQRHAETLDGLLATNDRAAIIKVQQDAQRLLEPVDVVNPFADRLGFADAQTRTRRDHVKYLTLIRAIALLHQHQRERRTATTADGRLVTYIEATAGDVALANRLAREVLGRSLDELPPQTRRLLEALDVMVDAIAEADSVDRDRVRFTRRQAREALGWGDTQLKIHLARLVDLELVWVRKGDRGGFVYELAYQPSDAEAGRFLPGLVDLDAAGAATGGDGACGSGGDRSGSKTDRSGSKRSRSGPGRPPVGPRSGGGRGTRNGSKPQANGHKPDPEPGDGQEGALPAEGEGSESYPQVPTNGDGPS